MPPATRAAKFRRLLAITVLLCPFYWTIVAVLEGNWGFDFAEAEPRRHFAGWLVIMAGSILVVYLMSVKPAFGPLHRFFAWLLSGRIIRRVFITAAWIVTLVVLFYAEENWRGARAWNNYRSQLEATGAKLDLAAFIPPAVPDDQNFAATAIPKSWFVEVDKTVFTNTTFRFARYWQDSYEQVATNYLDTNVIAGRRMMNLAGWGNAFDAIREGRKFSATEFESGKLDRASRAAAVPAVLAGLKTNEAVLAELQTASQRSLCRYPVIYDMENPWGIMLPHLINLRDACRRLTLRACAELAGGNGDAALADVKLMLYLADTIKDEPFLISHMVRIACVRFAVQPVWEGLAEHAWSDAQLQELEARLRNYNFVAAMKRPSDGERAAGILTAELIRKKGLGLLLELLGSGPSSSAEHKFVNVCSSLIPSGWYHLEQFNYCRFYEMQFAGAYDFAQKRIWPDRIDANHKEMEKNVPAGSFGKTVANFLRHRVVAGLILPTTFNIPIKTAKTQTAADQAALACALERFRLANASYPETLGALMPKFISQLPADVFTGQPFAYERTADGQFILRSVGWDKKDENNPNVGQLIDGQPADWIWEYPSK